MKNAKMSLTKIKAYDKIYVDIRFPGGDEPKNTGEQKKRKEYEKYTV